MIMWGFPVMGGALLASAPLLRRWPLVALAVTLGGSVAIIALQPGAATAELVVLAVAAAAWRSATWRRRAPAESR